MSVTSINNENFGISRHDLVRESGQASSLEVLPAEFYNQFISKLSHSRKPSPIRNMQPIEMQPGMLSMLMGKPNPKTFPFASLSMSIRSLDPNVEDFLITMDEQLLEHALQYGPPAGLPLLIKWLTNLMTHVHGRRDVGEDWRVTLGPGTVDFIYKGLLALVNPGDSIFIEAPTFSNFIATVATLKCNVVELETDDEGIVPSSMEAILDAWPIDKPYPKLLYTVPFGANPTGTTIPTVRRKAILELARRYNFLILEDDPYFHLYYGPEPQPLSYFALEKQMGGSIGRVLRFDSFSKVLSSGLRLGWATGPNPLISVIELHSDCSTLQASSMTQAIALCLLEKWGLTGYLNHTKHVSAFYMQRRDVCEALLQRHLIGLATWKTPISGMFFWIKLSLPASSSDNADGDSTTLIQTKAREKSVLVLPGALCFHDERTTPYVRITFSVIDDEDMDEALKRLAAAVVASA